MQGWVGSPPPPPPPFLPPPPACPGSLQQVALGAASIAGPGCALRVQSTAQLCSHNCSIRAAARPRSSLHLEALRLGPQHPRAPQVDAHAQVPQLPLLRQALRRAGRWAALERRRRGSAATLQGPLCANRRPPRPICRPALTCSTSGTPSRSAIKRRTLLAYRPQSSRSASAAGSVFRYAGGWAGAAGAAPQRPWSGRPPGPAPPRCSAPEGWYTGRISIDRWLTSCKAPAGWGTRGYRGQGSGRLGHGPGPSPVAQPATRSAARGPEAGPCAL